MRQLAGCRRCGHVEMAEGAPETGEIVGACPRCGGPLRAVGLLGARLLAQVRRYPVGSGRRGDRGEAAAARTARALRPEPAAVRSKAA